MKMEMLTKHLLIFIMITAANKIDLAADLLLSFRQFYIFLLINITVFNKVLVSITER